MRPGAVGLVAAFLIAGCRPIDEVVTRTSPEDSDAVFDGFVLVFLNL